MNAHARRLRNDTTLLTMDEARAVVVRSAIDTLAGATCGAEGALAMLWALPGGAGWSAADELSALEHRRTLEWVNEAGHGAVIAEELRGVMAATGLDDGELRDLDLVLSQLPVPDEQLAG
jgi:hypothetical protein